MIKTDSRRPCVICGEEKEFHDIDYLRTKPCQLKICSKCGFIFSDRFYNEQELEIYYEMRYRKQGVNVDHLITANRKLGFLEASLGKYLKEHKDLKICDIGAGIGYVLHWAKMQYGHNQIFGVEYDIKIRRYAKNAFGIDLTKEFDDTQKYDLIITNHVLEHVIDPRKELERIKNALTAKGIFYFGSPVWMENISFLDGNPGANENTFDGYFHEDHINCWTKQQLDHLLSQTGWKIKQEIKMNGIVYILIPATKEFKKETDYTKNGKETEIELIDMKRAIEAFKKTNFREAIRLYPKFVDAYIAESGSQQGKLELQIRILDAGIKMCPDSIILKTNKALLFFQYDKLEEAQQLFIECVKFFPHNENLLFHLAMIHFKYGEKCYNENKIEDGNKNWNECLQIFNMILQINPLQYQQVYNFIGHIYSNRILKGKEIKDNIPDFKTPTSKNAPQIELGLK
mgnify:CR=1 FL=1